MLTPELCVTSVTMNQFPSPPSYSHHRTQSALGETNWLLRASGCNLTLNPYLVIQMGHHHGHPLTRAMGLRPDHWSTTLRISPIGPKELRTYTDRTFLINQRDTTCIHAYIHIHHIQFLIIHLFRIPSETIPTHYSRTMNMELRLISLSCHIDTNPFASHVELIPNSSF